MTASQGVPEAAATASWTLGWRWILHILALLASLVAVATLVLGVHDALMAAALVPRLIGLLLTVCGVALLTAALLVCRYALSATHRTERLWVVAVLFLAGAVPGLLFFVLQASAFVFDWRILVELVAFLVPVAAAAAVLRASQPGEARRVWGRVWQSHQSPTAKAVASLLSAGVVVAAGQTLLSYYAPVKRGDSLSVTTKLVLADQHLPGVEKGGDVQALHGTVYVENAGDAKLFFLGGIYLVTGWRVPLRSAAAQTELLQKTLPKEIAQPRGKSPIGVGRYEAGSKVSLVETGRFFDPGTSWIAPGTNVELHFLAYAPKNQFAYYISTVQLLIGRTDRMELDAPPVGDAVPSAGPFVGMASVHINRRIVEASWVNLATRGTRHLYITYSVPTDRILTERAASWPQVEACVAFKKAQCSEKSLQRRIQRWRATYGVNFFPAWYLLETPAKS